MKKLIAIVSSLFLVSIISAKAEIGIGVSGAYHMIEGDGSETTRTSNQKNNGTHEEDVAVPEVFIEAVADNGFAFGFSYIPTRDLGSKSRSDSNSEGDTGTYKAAAELDDVMKIYVDIPLSGFNVFGGQGYISAGVQHVTISTLESLNSGSAYPNKDLFGSSIGLGLKGDLPYGGLYYKGEFTYTAFEEYEAVSDAGNKVIADLDNYTGRLSIGYKF